MAEEVIEVLVSGGKATAAPPLGPALGPMGVNIGQVVGDINKKTASFAGMQVPVKLIIDTETKKYEIEIGTPPTAELIKKEANIKKGSGNPLKEKVADLKVQQILKIAEMKQDAMLAASKKAQVKEVTGTCRSMGVLVEGVDAGTAMQKIEAGEFDQVISSGKTELSAEELKELEEEKKKLAEENKKRHDEFKKQAEEIIAQNKNAEARKVRAKLEDADIPSVIIDELVPREENK